MVCDTVSLVNHAIKQGKSVIVEGANATMLDIDFGESPRDGVCRSVIYREVFFLF